MKKKEVFHSAKQFSERYLKSSKIADKLRQEINQLEFFGFLINRIEHAMPAINFPKKGIKTSYFEVILLTQGNCYLEYNLQGIYQKSHQIRFSSPGALNLLKEKSDDIKGYYLSFSIDFFSLAANKDLIPELPFFFTDSCPLIDLDEETLKHFSNVFEHLLVISDNTNSKNENRTISTYLLALLLECKEKFKNVSFQNKKNTASNIITKNFFSMLNHNFSYNYLLKDYADKLNISSKHLTKSVKMTTGFPPSYFIKKNLVLEAKILLNETQDSVSEIAYHLGFEDVSYFIRFFKKNTQLTPVSYRKSQEN